MNYKQEVLKVYPDARVMFTGEGYYIYNGVFLPNSLISCMEVTEDLAWEDAYKIANNLPAPTHATITVTGCGDCPFHSFYGKHDWNHCSQTGNTESNPEYPLFATCPLKTSPITIKLNK